MQKLQDFWKTAIGKIVILGGGGVFALISLCLVCAVFVTILGNVDNNQPEAKATKNIVSLATDTPVPEPTSTPEPPTATLVPALSFDDIVQHPDQKGWSSTQYSTYFDTIRGQNVSGWSGTILEVKEYGGRPYLSLDMKSGEPEIDAYAYINEDDVLKVGLGQDVTFNGTIDDTWSENNGFYALQIEDVTFLELGPIPTPTPIPPTVTPKPTNTPAPAAEGETPLDVQPYVLAYVLGTGEKMQTMGSALSSISELMQNPQFGNDEWTIDVALQVVTVQQVHKELTEMDVPPEMSEIHEAVLDGTADCNEAMDYLVSGLDNGNIDDVNTAATLMAQCGNKMQKPTTMMQEYVNQQ